MTLHQGVWGEFSTYLFIDKKLSTSKGSTQSLRSRFLILCEYFKDKDFNRQNFTQFLDDLMKKGYKASYANGFIKTAKHLAVFLKVKHFEDYSYFREDVTQKDILSPEEVVAIAECPIEYYRWHEEVSKRYHALYLLLGLTGMRINEALTLRWTDLRQDPMMLMVRPEVAKSGKARYVPINQELWDTLHALPQDNTLIFHGQAGGVLEDSQINKDLKKRVEACGITKKDITCHAFRRSFISTLNRSGVPISMIAKIVGHANIETTYKYYIVTEVEELRTAMSFHPLLRNSLTLSTIKDRVCGVCKSLVDPKRFTLTIEEKEGSFSLTLTNVLSYRVHHAHTCRRYPHQNP